MGATVSRGSSPSLPAKCSLMETMTETRLFKVADYSKWVLMPAGTELVFDTIHLPNISYSVKVYPSGFDKEAADFVAVLAEPEHYSRCPYQDATRILLEILDGSGEQRTVFDDHTAVSWPTNLPNYARGYVRFVKRRELEASGCIVKRRELEASGCIVRDNSFTLRCTFSVDVRVTRPPAEVVAVLAADASSSTPVASGSHALAIGSLSKLKASLRAGECVHSTQFSLGGSSWYFKLYPNGHSDVAKHVSIFLARGRSHEPATTAEFCFEIANDVMEGPELFKDCKFTKCTFDGNKTEHRFPYHTVIGGDDSLVVRCHLRVIKGEEAEIDPC